MRLQLIAGAALLAIAAGPARAVADEQTGWRVAADSLLYSDTDNVLIVSPQVAVHRDLDDDGGVASGRVVVDAVSAASVDVISQATTRFSEVRTEVDLGLKKPVGPHVGSLTYRYSHEPDYDSHGLGFGLQRELGTSDSVLGLGYDVSLDTVGYTGTPSDAFSERLTSHTLVASFTQVLDRETLLRGVYTLSLQRGYMEKPYRFVPLFDRAGIEAAAADGVTLDLHSFDRYRLSLRPAEEVPDARTGHAGAMRLMRYVDRLPGSVRIDYQFFGDDWGVRAHTIEPAVQWKRTRGQTVAAYARVYLQQAARFWQRTYVVEDGNVPRFRTLDRDLSDYYVFTGGARFEWRGSRLSAYADASAMETVYSDYLFLTSRFALVVQGGLRLAL